MVMDPRIRAGIFAGESGGDYDALFGFSNRPGKAWSHIKPTQMTVGQVMDFTSQRGAGSYADWAKGQVGRVATPVGAYQIVGTTLKQAVRDLGIDPNTPFDQKTQDRLGQYILERQGTGAWEGYKGPRDPGSVRMSASSSNRTASTPAQRFMRYQAPEESGKEKVKRLLMAVGHNLPRMYRGEGTDFSGFQNPNAARKEQSQTINWLLSQGREDLAQAVMAGAMSPSDAASQVFKQSSPQAGIEVDGQIINPVTGEVIYAPEGGPPKDPKAELDAMKAYRGEADVVTYRAVRDGYERVRTSYEASRIPGSTGAPDVAMLFGYMKMLDPGSVVREGEFATAANSGGVGERVRNLYNQALKGDILTDEQRREIVNIAGQLYQQTADNLGATNKTYSGYNERYGIDGGFMITPEVYDPFDAAPAAPAPGGQMAPTAGGGFDPSRIQQR